MIQNPNDLIGTRNNPPGFDAVRIISRAARAYHNLAPYPVYSAMTAEWKTEERGPLPRCLPLPRKIVSRGATWLFGKGVTFRCPKNNQVGELVNDAWTANNMASRAKAMAVTGALSGGVALKWSYNEDEGGIRIHVLDPAEYVRFYWDPADSQNLLMARVQFPMYDAKNGVWNWYREDWTDTTLQLYKPLPMMVLEKAWGNDPNSVANIVDVYDKWEPSERRPNEFGVIPLWYIKNQEVGRETGEGDLWSVYHVIDLFNFTYDLAHKNNQSAITPKRAYIDLQAPTEDSAGADGPLGTQVLESKNADGPPGRIETLTADVGLRPHLREFAQDLKRMILECVGSVEINPGEVTNKGNLTSAVLTQLYAPLIEMTDSKRTTYGEDGICVFFERMAQGMAHLGIKGWSKVDDVQIHWGPYWPLTPEEKNQIATYEVTLLNNGLTTHPRAVMAIAEQDNIIDVDALVAETEQAKAEQEVAEKEMAATAASNFERARRGMTDES